MSSKHFFLLAIVFLLSACLDEGVAPHLLCGDAKYDIEESSSSEKSSSSLANSSSSSENLTSSSSETSSSSPVENSSSSFQDNESSSSIEIISSSSEEADFVKIGNQEWMTRNLNVNVTGSSCYKDNPENCEKYGRIYTWSMAMGIDISYDRKKYGTTIEPHQGICPSGSHLPSHEEWVQLNEFVKENPEYATYFQNQCGGAYDYRGYYRDENVEVLFMSSTEYDVSGTSYPYAYAWLWAIHNGSNHFDNDNGHKYTGAYVRCVKNL